MKKNGDLAYYEHMFRISALQLFFRFSLRLTSNYRLNSKIVKISQRFLYIEQINLPTILQEKYFIKLFKNIKCLFNLLI